MLRIAIPSPTISAKVFERGTLPTPPNGTETEVNGELILLFEDEEEAVAYLDELEDYSTELDSKSPEKPIINALVSAINNDEFVQAYLR
jgi:phage gp29-like protein